ncbi:MAG: protein-S-isoprenylcysteine O-methyltransferase [Symbiobacteriia bacterium]
MKLNLWNNLFVAGIAAAMMLRGRWTKELPEGRQSAARASAPERLLMALYFVGLVVLPAAFILSSVLDFANYQLPGWARTLGGVVFLAGVWLLDQSHRDLGKNWTAGLEVTEGHTLVTAGSFSRIRHPMYAAHWLMALGQLLLLPNWLAGVGSLVTFAPLYLLRVQQEEAMLLAHFGDPYREYMKHTGRVLPRVGK